MSDKHQKVEQAVNLLKALAHKERLLILCHLKDGELSVSQLLANSSLSQSALSQHLARLREEAIVKTRKEAQTVFYSLSSGNVSEIISALQQIYCGDQNEE